MAHSVDTKGLSKHGCAAILAALLAAAAAPGPAVADQQIGAAAVVVNNVTGTLATTRQRSVLRAGIDVFQNEVIDTADQSASRVVFQDRTELSIGAMSQVTLDRFVFDPNPTASAVAVSVAKGVARFSTGMLPKPNYTIRTPSAVIGVRGTVLTVDVSADRSSTISVQVGQISVGAAGATVFVNAGQTTFVRFGSPPTPPSATTAAPPAAIEMDRLLQSAAASPVPPYNGSPPSAGGPPPDNGPPPGDGGYGGGPGPGQGPGPGPVMPSAPGLGGGFGGGFGGYGGQRGGGGYTGGTSGGHTGR